MILSKLKALGMPAEENDRTEPIEVSLKDSRVSCDMRGPSLCATGRR